MRLGDPGIMKLLQNNNLNTIIAFSLYWLILSVSVFIAKKLEITMIAEWWMHTIVFLLFISFCILTFRTKVKIIYRLLLLPATWIAHAVMTIPAAMVLGIIMHDPNHIRTSGEHRAVFILASLPIIAFFVKKSKLFINEN